MSDTTLARLGKSCIQQVVNSDHARGDLVDVGDVPALKECVEILHTPKRTFTH
jgi:hypothetical protein